MLANLRFFNSRAFVFDRTVGKIGIAIASLIIMASGLANRALSAEINTTSLVADLSAESGLVKQKQKNPTTQVLINDSNPELCALVREGNIRDTCSSFSLIRIEEGDVAGYMLEFLFEGVRVTYVLSESAMDTVEYENKTFDIYAVAARVLELSGQEPEFSEYDEGQCATTPNFNELTCGFPDFQYRYISRVAN
jgi:hypothetical protein